VRGKQAVRPTRRTCKLAAIHNSTLSQVKFKAGLYLSLWAIGQEKASQHTDCDFLAMEEAVCAAESAQAIMYCVC